MRTPLLRQIFLLIALAFIPAIVQGIYFRGDPAWQSPPSDSGLVTLAEAKNWGAKALWIDARPEAEFARAHVPNALPLNEDNWKALLPAVLTAWTPERQLIIYCSRKTCNASHEVAERLRHEAGLTNVHVLRGGWEEWQQTRP